KTADAKPKADAPKAEAPKPAAQPTAAPAPKPAAAPVGDGKRVFASPLARRIAQQQGIDISSIHGSGPNGRIIRADVAGAISGGTAKAAPAPGAPQRPATLPAAPSFNAFGEPEFEL